MDIFKYKYYILALLGLNIFAAVYGIYDYYRIIAAKPWFTLLIIDCPLHIFLFCWFLIKKGKIPTIFAFIAMAGLVKYSILAITAGIVNFAGLASIGMYYLLGWFSSHSMMLLEAPLMFNLIKIKVWHLIVAMGWFLINDSVDFFFRTFHYIVVPMNLLAVVAYSLSIVVPVSLYLLRKKYILRVLS